MDGGGLLVEGRNSTVGVSARMMFREAALAAAGCAGTTRLVDSAGLLVVVSFPGTALEFAICLKLVAGFPVAARAGNPPGKLVDGLPATVPAGAPPARPVADDPMMALAGAPPGRPAAGVPITALEGAPPGRPLTGNPMMALAGAPPGGCALAGPRGAALVWAGSRVAGAAMKTKAASRISPVCAGHNLALKNGLVLFTE